MAKPVMPRFGDFILPLSCGCWIWLGYTNPQGYGRFNCDRKTFFAHRTAYEVYVDPIPEGLFVLHKCDVPGCVNPAHLFLGTKKDNSQDCIQKGRLAPLYGSKHGNAKLTERQVANIRLDPREYRIIAKDYGVSFSTIGYIKLRKTWKHIP